MAEHESSSSPRPQGIDVLEHGAERDGKPQVMNRRLFMQLLVFEVNRESSPDATARALHGLATARRVPSVIYADLHDPRAFGFLSWSEDPAHFVDAVRPLFCDSSLGAIVMRPELAMLGRTYSSGHEPDLAYWLLDRPRETALNSEWPWALWYPLRRSGAFARLDPREQGKILREHGVIGRTYAEKDLAHDIRLACHGLDRNDNEFVIGLIGKSLQPLSHVVETMRKTRQTSEFIVQMGPFFVGRAVSRVGL